MLRQIIKINTDRCDGCGICITACDEGALQIINNKAVLIKDDYCDGLGNCLPVCPQDAIRFELREAAEFDEKAVEEHLKNKAQSESTNSQQDLHTNASANSGIHSGTETNEAPFKDPTPSTDQAITYDIYEQFLLSENTSPIAEEVLHSLNDTQQNLITNNVPHFSQFTTEEPRLLSTQAQENETTLLSNTQEQITDIETNNDKTIDLNNGTNNKNTIDSSCLVQHTPPTLEERSEVFSSPDMLNALSMPDSVTALDITTLDIDELERTEEAPLHQSLLEQSMREESILETQNNTLDIKKTTCEPQIESQIVSVVSTEAQNDMLNFPLHDTPIPLTVESLDNEFAELNTELAELDAELESIEAELTELDIRLDEEIANIDEELNTKFSNIHIGNTDTKIPYPSETEANLVNEDLDINTFTESFNENINENLNTNLKENIKKNLKENLNIEEEIAPHSAITLATEQSTVCTNNLNADTSTLVTNTIQTGIPTSNENVSPNEEISPNEETSPNEAVCPNKNVYPNEEISTKTCTNAESSSHDTKTQLENTCIGQKNIAQLHAIQTLSTADAHVSVQTNSQLRQWPVQLKLVPVNASFLESAHLLIAADCCAYSYANFHNDFMRNKMTVIACPKLDNCDYSEKLTEILCTNNIKSVTVVRMEVPCCSRLEKTVITALKQTLEKTGKFLQWQSIIIGVKGNILE